MSVAAPRRPSTARVFAPRPASFTLPSRIPVPVFSDENFQRYSRALYPVASLLILVPLVDLTLRVYPPQFGSLQWRFVTVGMMLGNFGTMLLGLGLLGLVATINGHRGMLRAIGYISLALAAMTLAVLALFTLDAVQMRTLANANAKRAYLLSSTGAVFAGLFGAWTLFAIGRGALAVSRPAASGRRQRTAPSPLVVAGQGVGEG
jgi:hypothetical protein